MNQISEGALRPEQQPKQVFRCEKCVQKTLQKVEKLGYQVQYETLISEGFTDDKAILKALKKNKGDLTQATDYLKNSPPKKEKKSKHRKSDDEMEVESKKCSKKCKADKEGKSINKEERKSERKLQRLEQKYTKMVEEFPQFKEFNEKMKSLGFEDVKKNFKALKKNGGDQEKSASHLNHKKILETIQLCSNFSKGEIRKVYLDCNNCFYLESSFLKKARNGNFKEIEQKIATLMKVFQASYENEVEIVLVFDNSKIMKDEAICAQFLSHDYKMINAKPQFEIADDAMVYHASTEKKENQEGILYVTSDRLLQARLIEVNAQKIMKSGCFFHVIRDTFVGNKAYSAVIDQ